MLLMERLKFHLLLLVDLRLWEVFCLHIAKKDTKGEEVTEEAYFCCY